MYSVVYSVVYAVKDCRYIDFLRRYVGTASDETVWTPTYTDTNYESVKNVRTMRLTVTIIHHSLITTC